MVTKINVPQSKVVALERRIAVQIEMERKAAGLKPMSYHAGMSIMARNHSENLKKEFMRNGKRVLNHDGFNGRANKILHGLSMSKIAENVAYVWGGKEDAAVRIERNWMKSISHRDNILAHWTYTGVGVAVTADGTVYATQLFGL